MAQFYDESHRGYLSGSTLSQYVRVKLSGSTANTVVVATAADRDIGVTMRKVNTSGDPVDILGATHEGTTPMVASGAVTANAIVYGDAAGKVTATANDNPIGRALIAASNDGDVIEVQRLPALGMAGGRVSVAVAASTAVANTTNETAFDKNYTFPANTLQAGDVIKVKFQGIATATNSTDTLAIKLYLATAIPAGAIVGTAILTLAARDVANNDIFMGEADIVIRTAGASGTLVACGISPANPNAAGTAMNANFVASTTVDTTAAQIVAVTATWSVANAGDSCRLDILNITRVPALS